MTAPRPPADLKPKGRGRRFWRQVHTEFDFGADDLELLAETCRILDLVDQLREAADPPVIEAP